MISLNRSKKMIFPFVRCVQLAAFSYTLPDIFIGKAFLSIDYGRIWTISGGRLLIRFHVSVLNRTGHEKNGLHFFYNMLVLSSVFPQVIDSISISMKSMAIPNWNCNTPFLNSYFVLPIILLLISGNNLFCSASFPYQPSASSDIYLRFSNFNSKWSLKFSMHILKAAF